MSRTPGPWTYEDLIDVPNPDITEPYRIIIFNPDGEVPCTIDYSGNEPETYGEDSRADHEMEHARALADAKLIAAAPDLLAACEPIVELFEACKAGYESGHDPLHKLEYEHHAITDSP